jgi:predicted transcriptional regulator
MASHTVKSVTISLPAEMLQELDRLRKREHRSRSELLREAFRQYVAGGPARRIPIVDPEPGELEALEYGRRQTERGEYVLLEDLLDGLDADRRARRRERSQKVSD